MFNSELLNQIIDAIPPESAAVKVKALCLLTLVDSLGELSDEYIDENLVITNDIRAVLDDGE